MKYIKAFLLGILIYIFGIIIIFLGAGYGFEGIGKIRGEHETLALIITFCLPFIMVFSSDFKTGFGYFALSLFIANAVFPALDWSYGSPYPKFGQMSPSVRRSPLDDSSYSGKNQSVSGVYQYNDYGVITKILVSGSSWYGETFMEDSGALLSSSSGEIDGSDIMDEYGNKIGHISNGTAYVTINGTRLRLTKD